MEPCLANGGGAGTDPFVSGGGGGGTGSNPFVSGGGGGGGGMIPGTLSVGGGGKVSSIVRSSRLGESSGGGGRLSILASLAFLSSSSLSCFSCKCKKNIYTWASTRQTPSSGFLTKRVSNQYPQLQRLARKLKFCL